MLWEIYVVLPSILDRPGSFYIPIERTVDEGVDTVEFRFFEPPREMEIGSKNREFEKSKVASNQTCFTVELFYKIQGGTQQRYITLV